jgi:hypothetical protein
MPNHFPPLACTLAACFLMFHPLSAKADALPNIEITTANGFASWGDYADGCNGICASLSAPNFTLNFQSFVPPPGYTLSPGDPLMTYFALAERFGAQQVPNSTVIIDGITYPVAFPDGSVNLIAPTIIVPSGYATIQLPTFLTGTGIACTAVYGVDGCSPPPGAAPYPVQIADVSLFLKGYLTLTFRPGSGPAAVNEDYTATFTPIPEPASALLVIAILAPLVARMRRNAQSSGKASR